MTDLSGQTALVTGASRGIGRAIAIAYAAAGAHVICAARTMADLETVAHGIEDAGGSASVVPLDATDAGSVSQAFDQVAKQGLDIAVLNAGVFAGPATIVDGDIADWHHVFAVNVFGVVACAKAAVPLMSERGGKIIVMGSGTGHRASEGVGAYGASKAAVASVVETLSIELRASNIAVNELVPGPVNTGITGQDEEASGVRVLTGSMQDWSKEPADVTGLALLLAGFPNGGPSGQTFSLMGRLMLQLQSDAGERPRETGRAQARAQRIPGRPTDRFGVSHPESCQRKTSTQGHFTLADTSLSYSPRSQPMRAASNESLTSSTRNPLGDR